MRNAYKILGGLIALLVFVQAASIAFAFSGLGVWIEDGNTLDAAAMESQSLDFTGVLGFPVHAITGMMLIPLLSLILLIVSFFAKLPKGVPTAAALLGLVIVQVLLGITASSTAYAGLLHGINALLVFGAAVSAARLAMVADRVDAPAART